MGLSELVGGPCVSNGIILKEGGGWGMKQVGLLDRYFFSFSLRFPPFKSNVTDL